VRTFWRGEGVDGRSVLLNDGVLWPRREFYRSEGIGRSRIRTLFSAREAWRGAARRGVVTRAVGNLFVNTVWTGPGSSGSYGEVRGVRGHARGLTVGLLTNHERREGQH
jgi:hypothetical protein